MYNMHNMETDVFCIFLYLSYSNMHHMTNMHRALLFSYYFAYLRIFICILLHSMLHILHILHTIICII
jgi:hypothetical protein